MSRFKPCGPSTAYEAALHCAGTRRPASVLDYIANRSPQGALRIQSRIQAITNLLLQYPWAGVPTEDPSIRRMTTMPYPYLIFYEATDSEIIIHAVRHGARDVLENPKER